MNSKQRGCWILSWMIRFLFCTFNNLLKRSQTAPTPPRLLTWLQLKSGHNCAFLSNSNVVITRRCRGGVRLEFMFWVLSLFVICCLAPGCAHTRHSCLALHPGTFIHLWHVFTLHNTNRLSELLKPPLFHRLCLSVSLQQPFEKHSSRTERFMIS